MQTIQEIDSRNIESAGERTMYVREGLILNPRVVASQEVGRTILQGRPYRIREHRIIRVVKGCISLQVNLRKITIGAGMLAYVKAGAIMEIMSFHPETEAMLMGFDAVSSPSSIRQYSALIGLSAETDMLLSLIEAAVSKEPYRKEYVGHLVSALYSLVVSSDEDVRHAPRGRKEDLFNKFLALVENTPQKHSIPYFAEKLHVAPHYLSRVVSEVSGSSVMEWVRRSIVLQAKVLLKNTDKPVLTISEELGFTTLPFFCRFFKTSTGYTPTEYRQSVTLPTDRKGSGQVPIYIQQSPALCARLVSLR